jgi:hypothetical protein
MAYHFGETLAGSKWENLKGWHVFRHSMASILASDGVVRHRRKQIISGSEAGLGRATSYWHARRFSDFKKSKCCQEFLGRRKFRASGAGVMWQRLFAGRRRYDRRAQRRPKVTFKTLSNLRLLFTKELGAAAPVFCATRRAIKRHLRFACLTFVLTFV